MAINTVRAGHIATVGDFDAIGTTVLKTSTESVTSSTTLQNDDQLFLAVVANAKYAIEGLLLYDGAGAGDFKVAFTTPSGATINWGGTAPQSGVGVNSLNANVATASGAALAFACNGAGNTMLAQPKGYLAIGATAGNLQLQWAQQASSATATRVFLGSQLKLTRIA